MEKPKPPIYFRVWFFIVLAVVGFFGVVVTEYALLLWLIDIVLIILRIMWPIVGYMGYKPTETATQSKTLARTSPDLNVNSSKLKEEILYVVGVQHYENNLKKLACPNPDYRKAGKTLSAEDKCMKKIFQYSYINKPVKLIPEPENLHDSNAVMVQIAGEKIGYISRDENQHVKQILSNHDIKFISSFISGGKYKVVSENGDAEKFENSISVKVKIGYT